MKQYHLLWITMLVIGSGWLCAPAPQVQSQDAGTTLVNYNQYRLTHDEAWLVYYANRTRREHGLPPMRWTQLLTEASRRFSEDATRNQLCGHFDSQGRDPFERAQEVGYPGKQVFENVFCGYMAPEQAVDNHPNSWMESPRHRENLLQEGMCEVGTAYHVRDPHDLGKGGYTVQIYGCDTNRPPVIIQDEAPFVEEPEVRLFIHRNLDPALGTDSSAPEFVTIGQTQEIMVSNEPDFAGAEWQPYQAELNWVLPAGEGDKTVYVKHRDASGRTLVVNDSVFLGDDLVFIGPDGFSMMRPPAPKVAQITNLDNPDWPYVQYNPGWLFDHTHPVFEYLYVEGEVVADADAIGGSAYRMQDCNEQSGVWMPAKIPASLTNKAFTVYVRLKASDLSAEGEIALIEVVAGSGSARLPLTAADFEAENTYQDFRLPVRHIVDDESNYLEITVRRSTCSDVFFDQAKVFRAPQSFEAGQPLELTMTPDMNYKGQDITLRYVDEAGNFSPSFLSSEPSPDDPPPSGSSSYQVYLPWVTHTFVPRGPVSYPEPN